MSAQYFLYTWSVPVGQTTTNAEILVRAETPEKARLAIKNEAISLKSLYNSICLKSISDKYGRESAESLKSNTGYKLRILAAATLGVNISQAVDEMQSPEIPNAIVKILESIEPLIEPTFTPKLSWDREPEIIYHGRR